MKKLIFLAVAAAGFMTAGFSCSETEDPQQVDRMGRAGVNTAVTDPFYIADDAAQQARHDENAQDYNGNDTASSWTNQYLTPFKASLAILDSLDTNCGNQLVADGADDRYALLSTVLTDDRLYVNTASGECNQYLAVEGNAVGITNNDCGGRTPLYDTIDTTYSVLAIGALSGVDDGISGDLDASHSNSVFPFLAAPGSMTSTEMPAMLEDESREVTTTGSSFSLTSTVAPVVLNTEL